MLRYLLFLSTVVSLHLTVSGQQVYSVFNVEQRLAHLARLEDSTAWDVALLAQETEDADFFADVTPILPGVFPVPPYDAVGEGSFDGIFEDGTLWAPQTIAGKTVVYHSFGVGNNAWNRPFMGEDTTQVYFTLITVTDTLEKGGGAVRNGMINSRNNPDVIAEGVIYTTVSRIDYVAFMTAENERFAIVNLRLFNLKYGDIIVIAPQKDGTFRTLQIQHPPRNKAANNRFIQGDVLKRKEVVAFLNGKGVI